MQKDGKDGGGRAREEQRTVAAAVSMIGGNDDKGGCSKSRNAVSLPEGIHIEFLCIHDGKVSGDFCCVHWRGECRRSRHLVSRGIYR